MFERFLKSSTYSMLKNAVADGTDVSVFGLNKGEKLALVEDSAFLFYVVSSIDDVNALYDDMLDIGRRPEILTESLDIFSSPFMGSEHILKTLYKIKNNDIDTLIITPNILCAKYPRLDSLNEIVVNKGDELNVQSFVKKLISLGYKRVDVVASFGEFSVRGDIIDVFSIMGEPTRIYAEYDNVDAIKLYDAVTMLSSKDIDSVTIRSVNFYNVSSVDIDRYYLNHSVKKNNIYYELLEGVEIDYRKVAFGDFVSIFDFVTDGTIAFDGAKNIYLNVTDCIADYNAKIKEMDSESRKVFEYTSLSEKDVLDFKNNTLVSFHHITENNRLFRPQKVFSVRTLPSVNYTHHEDILVMDVSNYNKNGYTIILCAGSSENSQKLASIFTKNHLQYIVQNMLSQCNIGAINIVPKNYPNDIILPEDKLAVISTPNLFGKKKRIIESKDIYLDGEVPESGDYVVHNFHGIGKCLGVETLKIGEGNRDYVIIEYKNNGKLFLPVENLSEVTKFIGGEKEPTLSKIGGADFAKTKEKVKTAVKKIAFDLIALYRDRLNTKGMTYPKDSDLEKSFENSFPFEETPDQLKAISDCKTDMESGKVMDRLVCGDVGYGKTEVALRIAFKTIVSGKQVAFLCPTTILSEQHYNTAKSRMYDFGVRVEVLNRLKEPKEIERIKSDISSGKVDLICGTHKLLSGDIDYKNLGLLILDEEQKFGVADKEKIKNLKKKVNVLTLSATPIPRTLNMSLIGVRDISIIATPPVQRQSSVVEVVEYSDELIRNAISREIARGGQVLVVYNKVEDIYSVASRIHSLAQDATISVAHGQMSSTELEKEIFNLYSGKTQVLVATTLIENGVDLPRANTLIVLNADNLGLSQLYQLKGRIGRSDKVAYAYFTYNSSKNLSENAYKRLSAIEEFSEMGSGFKIAMRDLEIRGAGTILGLEQSGHIEKIGYNTYVQLLGDSVRELRGEKVQSVNSVRVETSLSAYLSHNYVESATRRMSMYREISLIDTVEKLVQFVQNTESIYGDMPEDLMNLCKISLVKNMAAKIGAEKLIIKKTCKIFLSGKNDITKALLDATNAYSEVVRLNLSQATPIIEIESVDLKELLDFLTNYLQLAISC